APSTTRKSETILKEHGVARTARHDMFQSKLPSASRVVEGADPYRGELKSFLIDHRVILPIFYYF
ncbi:MAG: hypothetical protein J6Q82_08675, partial [Clostridia bacterium]|nr:hypothetical protein [Clostridia bacterium]